jgi:amino acid adenylation domain-containing protein
MRPEHGSVASDSLLATGGPLLYDYLVASARHFPDKVALVCHGRRVTYADIDRRSDAVAHALRDRGVRRGDRVVVFLDNGVEAAIAFWAVLKADAIVAMVHPQTKANKLAYILADSGAAAVVSDVQLARVYEPATASRDGLHTVLVTGHCVPDGKLVSFDEAAKQTSSMCPLPRRNIDVDLAALVYTSGSTGEPKGVMLTHRNMLTAASSISTYLELRDDDVILDVLPLSFDYGLYQMILAARMGARLVLEKGFAYPPEILQLVVDERVTGFPGVPTLFAMLASMKSIDAYDLSSVRFVTNTAAALPVKHIGITKQIFPKARIYSMYGLTECKRCTYLPPEDLERKPTSVGIAIPNTELWIVDDQNHRVGPDVTGQLVIRGATVMAGYWGKPQETALRLRPGPLPGERVLYTGDYCRTDEEGYLYFVGRMDDIIKSRGEKVAPKEIESVLYAIPGVEEAAVIGVPDEVLGQVAKAYVVFAEGAQIGEKELRRFCQERLESFKVPKHFEVAASLPRNNNGKIDKRALA